MSLTFSEIVSKALLDQRGVTFRRYGPHGEFTRPMVHRFSHRQLKGSVTLLEASLVQHNSLFRNLMMKKRKTQTPGGSNG